MKVSCIFFIVAAAFFKAVIADEGDEVLAGYLVLSDDSKCLGTDGTSVGTPSSTSQTDLAAACIKLSLLEGSTTNKYKIVKKETPTDKLVLANSAGPSYTTDGTEIQFSDENNLIDATAANAVTTKADSFLIQLATATVTDTGACLTATPDYKATTCGTIKWYFIEYVETATTEAADDSTADDSTADDTTNGESDDTDSETTTTAGASTLTHAPLLSVVLFVLGMKSLAFL